LGATVANRTYTQEGIKSASHHSVQILLSSCLLSKKLEIKIYNIIILSSVLYLSLKLKEEHRLGEVEQSVLRRIFGSKREELVGGWRRLHNEELHKLYAPTFFRIIK
jgi:hypothetical protein